MSRLDTTFARIRQDQRGGLVAYLTAGDPDPVRSAELLRAVARAGADVLEIGVPFSDPLADGPAIQRAIERALAGGMTLRGTLDVVRRTRADVDTPLVLFTYANPVIRMGEDRFAHEAADAGIDGVLVLDYPIEEAGRLRTAIVDAGLDPILLVSPTTTDERIRRSADVGRGFLYLISRLGVTGVRDSLDGHVEHVAQRVRACTDMPLAVGFGISRPEHVAHACTFADAAVVGSALVQIVAEHGSSPEVVGRAADYVRWLKSAL